MSYGDGPKPHILPCTWPGHEGRWRYRRGGYLHPQSFAWLGLIARLGKDRRPEGVCTTETDL